MFQGRRILTLTIGWLIAVTIVSAQTASAQTQVNAGAFIIEFWNPADGDGSYLSGTINSNDLGTWTAAEQQALVRAAEYWTDVLNLSTTPAANAPIFRAMKDISQPTGNAFAQPLVWSTATPAFGGVNHSKTTIYSRLVEGTNPGRLEGVDGATVYEPGAIGGNTYNTDRVTQYMPADFALERTAIHEIGHLLGISGTSIWNQFVVPDPGGNPFFDLFAGPNSVATFGGGGVPVQGAHVFIDYTNFTRGRPFNQSFRNIPFFSPAELSIFADLGYNINLNDHFASAFYQDGNAMMMNNTDVFNSTKDYGVGVWIQSSTQNINQTGNLTSNGFAGAGVRVADGLDNTFTLDGSAAINANGEEGIGVVASAGANSIFVIRGDVNANGTNGVGFRFDFGPSLTFSSTSQIDSTFYNAPLVQRLDISGAISATTNAIQISDTAGIGSINFMNGASINGDIMSDALVSPGDNIFQSLMTFGYEADMKGQVTATPDNTFAMTYNGNIGGSTPFDVTFAGGQTNLGGTTTFDDADILPDASLATSGTFNSSTLDVNSGATAETIGGGSMNVSTFNLMNGGLLVNNGVINSNSFMMGAGSRLEGNGLISANNPITLNGTTAPGNSIGTMTFNSDVTFSPSSITEIEVQPSANPVPGTDNDLIQVNGSATFNGGSVDVIGLPNNGAYTAGATYTYVTATGGVAVNTAPVFTEDLVNFRTVPFFTFNSAGFMLANDAAYGPQGISYNQRNVGNYLDIVKQNAGNTLVQSLRDQLDLLPGPSAVRGALDNLSGEIYGSSAIYQIQSMSHLMDVLANQVHHNHSPAIPCMDELWYSGYATSGQADHDGNAHDTDLNSIGHIVGKSWCVGPQTVLGVFYNYEDQRARAFGVGSTLDTDAHRLGYYLRDQRGVFHTVFTAFTGWMNAESERVVSVNALTERNRGDYNGWNAGFLLEQGATVGNTYVQTQPFVSIQYLHAQTENFTENGGAVTSLRVNDIDLNSFRTKVGNRLNLYTFRKLLSVDLEGAWIYEVGDSVANYDGGLTSAPGTQFAARGTDLGENWFNIGPSMNWMTGPFRTYLEYRAALGEQANLHSGQWGTELIW